MIGPQPIPLDPWDSSNADVVVWRERERRQRTIRVLMMFLLMLLLMDGEEGNGRNRSGLRQRKKKTPISQTLEPEVYQSRLQQDETIRSIAVKHPRYQALIKKNGGKDVQVDILKWAEQQAEQERDEFEVAGNAVRQMQRDPEEDKKVLHFPWNATGFYRGEWTRGPSKTADKQNLSNRPKEIVSDPGRAPEQHEKLDAVALEEPLFRLMKDKGDNIGVFVLPPGKEIILRDDNNLTSIGWESMTVDASGRTYRTQKHVRQVEATEDGTPSKPVSVTLEHDSGRAAFQIFSRSIPLMKEISLVDGFVKLYDSTSQGYSTRKDILLRVKGVMVHAIGRVSLVSNVDVNRSALILGDENRMKRDRLHRHLSESLEQDHSKVHQIRDDAISLYGASDELGPRKSLFESPEWKARRLTETEQFIVDAVDEEDPANDDQSVEVEDPNTEQENKSTTSVSRIAIEASKPLPSWSKFVIPYPFVRDDKEESIRRVRTAAARRMPPREQLLEENAANCEFEINLDVQEVEWTVGSWRSLLVRRFKEAKTLDRASKANEPDGGATGTRSLPKAVRTRSKFVHDQALVTTMVGTIYSGNCDFQAALNVTALRTDWEATTSKAINYSFYMMVVCLTQILILLRQLLHSQSQSAAVRVSLLCVGWQTVDDAIICLAHIYLSLAMQPLFTAFASVAFFKLLIFCVIEMKYMAMIIQARNSSNGGQTAEVLRRQIAMLHVRFYVALFGAVLLSFYVGEKYRTLYMLAMYSFWVPQILLNIYTEAKNPLHPYFIYGMTVSRMVAPVYMFGVSNNFLKEVFPDSPTDPWMCQLLMIWMTFQAAILVAQTKYGARFMIPARFLPPKFDYSRPLPASMLPPGAQDHVVAELIDEASRGSSSSSEKQAMVGRDASPGTRDRHTTAVTTRNRMRGNRGTRNESTHTTMMTTEPMDASPPTLLGPTIDCSICYDAIDVRNRRVYMLAPCDHIFHRDCLVQWMDVKMECPICRTELPAV